MVNSTQQPTTPSSSPTSAVGTMPAPPSQSSQSDNPTEFKKKKKKFNFKLIGGIVALLVVTIGAGAGYFLTQVNQDVRQQASTGTYTACFSTGQTRCNTATNEKEICNGSLGWQATGSSCFGMSCDSSVSLGTDLGSQALCCQGGATECASNACSGAGNGTYGLCLAEGGNTGGPTDEQCKEDYGPQAVRCGDCGGFCNTDPANKTCLDLAYEKSDAGQCPGGIQTGGSCATEADGEESYDEFNRCTRYCTNQAGRNGQQCGNVSRPCTYVGPEDPNYDVLCPNGNGFSDFGWNGSCFTDVDTSIYNVNSYYCECPNGDCTGVTLGQGCQLNPIYDRACFQDEQCGILQVDVDIKPGETPPTGFPSHSSRNILLTSGCNQVQVTPTPAVTPSPTPSTPPGYYCNSDCTTDAQCQGADSRFICDQASGGKCRLSTNTTSPECQPAVGPQCLSISMTNVSNPNAAATADPSFGDSVRFTCGTVQGAQSYIFKVIEPDGTQVQLQATGATSETYQIDKEGGFAAQCQICTGTDPSTCLPFENPFN